MILDSVKRVPTGIEALDALIEGGFPRPSSIGLMGNVGSGKSIFCNQVAWNLLQRGFNVLYYAVDEPAEDVRMNMERFSWDVTPYEERGALKFVDVYSQGMELVLEKTKSWKVEELAVSPDRMVEIPFNLREMILQGKEYFFTGIRGRDLLMIFDSVTPLFQALEAKNVLRFLQSSAYACRISKAIGIATIHTGIHGEQIENACQQLADGVIEFRKRGEEGGVSRFIRIVKMRATKIYEEYCPMEITRNGIVIHNLPLTAL
ncbi:MAG: ATPase domain-containing protein [Candidatus Bathyarchaeia archaeon]